MSSRVVLGYRILAWVTGVWLLLLLFVAMPVKYLGDDDDLVQVVGPVHGWLYFGYVVFAFAVAQRLHWDLLRTVGLLLAGTIPFLSFVGERKVVAALRQQDAAAQAV